MAHAYNYSTANDYQEFDTSWCKVSLSYIVRPSLREKGKERGKKKRKGRKGKEEEREKRKNPTNILAEV